MRNRVYSAIPTTLANGREVRLMRIAIRAAVLFCSFVLPGQARPTGPLAQHQQNGPVFCPWIGVAVKPMTRAFADSLDMAQPYGGIFGQPKPGSPAAKAGIEVGDVITAIDRQHLMRSRDFSAIISKMAPGTVIDLTTFRDGELMDRQVTLAYSYCTRRFGARRRSKTWAGAGRQREPYEIQRPRGS